MRQAVTTALRHYVRNRVIRKRLPSDLGGSAVFCSPDALLSTWKARLAVPQARNLFDWVRWFVRTGQNVWGVGANLPAPMMSQRRD
jgi:hypothetical protein